MCLLLQVRRLRIQHKIKSTEKGIEDVAENEEVPEYTSAIPLLAPMVCLLPNFESKQIFGLLVNDLAYKWPIRVSPALCLQLVLSV